MSSHADNPQLELAPSLPCTRHNFIALYHYLQASGQQPRQPGLLTSGWHLERALLFAQQATQFFRFQQPMEFIPLPSEELLGQFIEVIVGNHEAEFQARRAAEQRGLKQILGGSYEDSCLKHSPGIIDHVNLALI